MKAMIFAAGLGTRLRPLTDHMPKALVPVAGIPMLQRVILRLKAAGFDHITVNIHHFGQQIIDFLKANDDFGVTIHISDERDELLDTGGGIRKARPFLDGNEPFLVHNADILTDLDLSAFYRHHQESKAEATLLVARRKTSRYLLMDSDMRLRGWINKATGETRPEGIARCMGHWQEWAFGGIHVISPTLFRQMEGAAWEGRFSIIPFYLSICRDTCLQGYQDEHVQWFDIGKPETLEQASRAMME
ncbi:MAG: nucleotidyltransferase family protein [Bacteroides sp.]|nr:nucleotidyltransferase family protein [Bacteroides sp.]